MLGKQEHFGVAGYNLRTTCEFDKVLGRKIVPAKIPGMIETVIRAKKHMPDTFYSVGGTLVGTKKSDFSKSPRHLPSDDIARWNKRNLVPGPGAHKINEVFTSKKISCALNFKAEKTDSSFLGEALYKG